MKLAAEARLRYRHADFPSRDKSILVIYFNNLPELPLLLLQDRTAPCTTNTRKTPANFGHRNTVDQWGFSPQSNTEVIATARKKPIFSCRCFAHSLT